MSSILIIDDDPVTRKYVSHILGAGGYQIDLASEGKEGILKARRQKYDVAVVDLVLPGEYNGMDIIKNIKVLSPSTKIVAFSAFSGQTASSKTTTAGADAFVSKSYTSEQLLITIDRLLGVRRVSEEDFFHESAQPETEEKMPEPAVNPPAEIVQNFQRKEVFRPKILTEIPKEIVAEVMELGETQEISAGAEYHYKYTMETAIIISGKITCKYRNQNVFTLFKGESLGEESFFLTDDPDFTVTLVADTDTLLRIIPKEKLEDYFAKQDQRTFIMFQTNVILSLSRKLVRSLKNSPLRQIGNETSEKKITVATHNRQHSGADIIDLLSL